MYTFSASRTVTHIRQAAGEFPTAVFKYRSPDDAAYQDILHNYNKFQTAPIADRKTIKSAYAYLQQNFTVDARSELPSLEKIKDETRVTSGMLSFRSTVSPKDAERYLGGIRQQLDERIQAAIQNNPATRPPPEPRIGRPLFAQTPDARTARALDAGTARAQGLVVDEIPEMNRTAALRQNNQNNWAGVRNSNDTEWKEQWENYREFLSGDELKRDLKGYKYNEFNVFYEELREHLKPELQDRFPTEIELFATYTRLDGQAAYEALNRANTALLTAARTGQAPGEEFRAFYTQNYDAYEASKNVSKEYQNLLDENKNIKDTTDLYNYTFHFEKERNQLPDNQKNALPDSDELYATLDAIGHRRPQAMELFQQANKALIEAKTRGIAPPPGLRTQYQKYVHTWAGLKTPGDQDNNQAIFTSYYTPMLDGAEELRKPVNHQNFLRTYDTFRDMLTGDIQEKMPSKAEIADTIKAGSKEDIDKAINDANHAMLNAIEGQAPDADFRARYQQKQEDVSKIDTPEPEHLRTDDTHEDETRSTHSTPDAERQSIFEEAFEEAKAGTSKWAAQDEPLLHGDKKHADTQSIDGGQDTVHADSHEQQHVSDPSGNKSTSDIDADPTQMWEKLYAHFDGAMKKTFDRYYKPTLNENGELKKDFKSSKYDELAVVHDELREELGGKFEERLPSQLELLATLRVMGNEEAYGPLQQANRAMLDAVANGKLPEQNFRAFYKEKYDIYKSDQANIEKNFHANEEKAQFRIIYKNHIGEDGNLKKDTDWTSYNYSYGKLRERVGEETRDLLPTEEEMNGVYHVLKNEEAYDLLNKAHKALLQAEMGISPDAGFRKQYTQALETWNIQKEETVFLPDIDDEFSVYQQFLSGNDTLQKTDNYKRFIETYSLYWESLDPDLREKLPTGYELQAIEKTLNSDEAYKRLNEANKALLNAVRHGTEPDEKFRDFYSKVDEEYTANMDQKYEDKYQEDRKEAVDKLDTGGKPWFEVLAISPKATYADAKKAYRKLSLQYHPDKLARMDDGPDKEAALKAATDKMAIINNAWQKAQSVLKSK